jgi:hypothetical protein
MRERERERERENAKVTRHKIVSATRAHLMPYKTVVC